MLKNPSLSQIGAALHTDRDPLLNDVEQALLWQVRKQPPPDGRLWNGRKVADWMRELKGEKACRQRGWEYLKSMKFRLRVPRPEHQESDILEPEEWEKKSTSSSQQNQEKIPFKRRRSLVNGRIPARIETCERGENGSTSLVMPQLLLIGGFNRCGYTVLYIRVQGKQRRGFCHS